MVKKDGKTAPGRKGLLNDSNFCVQEPYAGTCYSQKVNDVDRLSLKSPVSGLVASRKSPWE